MKTLHFTLGVFISLVLVGNAATQAPALDTAHATVDKADKESLTIRPRGPEGKFAKSITLKLTGTSKVTTVTIQKRDGKPVLVQRETDPKGLQMGQPIAVIYAKDGMVLLAAVVESAPEKVRQ